MRLIESIVAEAASMAALRRDLHAHPELAFQERRTADVIAVALTESGIPIHRGLGTTGVVGVIRKGSSDRAVGFRADMDALPIQEGNAFPHASLEPGRMHACGHDGHVVMLLAAARHLAHHGDFDGTVVLVFQPAEEGTGGARELIKGGLFDLFPMEAIFGIHNLPGLGVGQVALRSGPCFASSNTFRITLEGKGAHAAMPHLGVDPVPAACQLVQGFQTIVSRNVRPIDACVVSVTKIHAGEAANVIPERCVIEGTVRTYTLEVLDLVERRMKAMTEATAAAFECTSRFELRRMCPPLVNHEAEVVFARKVLGDVVGPENVLDFEPTMGAEDFSFYLLEKPGCFFALGAGDGSHRGEGHGPDPCTLHNPSYDFNDDLIPIGASAWVRLAEAWLERPRAIHRHPEEGHGEGPPTAHGLGP
ncbi:MAG: M20 aminoacylase family protein [Thermoanaerobaculia bacterium]